MESAGAAAIPLAVGDQSRPERSFWRGLVRLARRKPLGALAVVVIGVVVVAALFAPRLAPYDPLVTNPVQRLQLPSLKHPLGTDNLGRDVLSRIIHGARVSLWVGFLATMIGTGCGAAIGIGSGYVGGKADLVVQRFVDALQTIPGLILALVLISVFGPSVTNAIVAIAIVIAPSDSRVLRSATLATKVHPYVEAAQVVGCRTGRIIVRHIVPNVVAPMLILASIRFAQAILIEASLSFLGLGAPPPQPSWGNMLSGSGRQYMEQVPTLALFPGMAIALTTLAFNLLGDTLRDIFDPRLRGT
ncbi:MAG: ABC transporter permease [Dehalococcoidia bacterium]